VRVIAETGSIPDRIVHVLTVDMIRAAIEDLVRVWPDAIGAAIRHGCLAHDDDCDIDAEAGDAIVQQAIFQQLRYS
jgi:hypothetical protein